MNDTPTLVRFEAGYKLDGIGSDGLPLYITDIKIVLSRPPWLGVTRSAEDNDMLEHPGPFALFQKVQAARSTSFSTGYPLCMWPACTEAEFQMLAERDITTVEQLAKLHRPKAPNPDLPAQIRELAERAFNLVKLQSGPAKYEEFLREANGRIEALTEALDDAKKTIAAQASLIETLKLKMRA